MSTHLKESESSDPYVVTHDTHDYALTNTGYLLRRKLSVDDWKKYNIKRPFNFYDINNSTLITVQEDALQEKGRNINHGKFVKVCRDGREMYLSPKFLNGEDVECGEKHYKPSKRRCGCKYECKCEFKKPDCTKPKRCGCKYECKCEFKKPDCTKPKRCGCKYECKCEFKKPNCTKPKRCKPKPVRCKPIKRSSCSSSSSSSSLFDSDKSKSHRDNGCVVTCKYGTAEGSKALAYMNGCHSHSSFSNSKIGNYQYVRVITHDKKHEGSSVLVLGDHKLLSLPYNGRAIVNVNIVGSNNFGGIYAFNITRTPKCYHLTNFKTIYEQNPCNYCVKGICNEKGFSVTINSCDESFAVTFELTMIYNKECKTPPKQECKTPPKQECKIPPKQKCKTPSKQQSSSTGSSSPFGNSSYSTTSCSTDSSSDIF